MPENKTEKTGTWVTDSAGRKALLADGSLDRWKPLGWSETAEPAPGDLVWLEHEDHHGKQLFDRAVVDTWGALGWKPSAPPEPADPTKDKNLVDVAPTTADEDTKTKATKSATPAKKEQ